MDFLPLPPGAHASSFEIEIEHVKDIAYDDGDFSTYPERQGWTERTVGEWLHLFQNPSREFTKFMERWLLFGIVSHLFRGAYSYNDFIRSVGDPPRLVLTMMPLCRFLEAEIQYRDDVLWAPLIAIVLHGRLSISENDGDYDEHNLHITQTLIQGIKVRRFKDPRSPEMAFITTVWLEVMMSWLSFPDPLDFVSTKNLSGQHKSIIWKLLRQQDWCPANLTTAFHRFNTSSLYFLHAISPRHSGKGLHKMISVRTAGQLSESDFSRLPSSSDLCSPFFCGLNQLNDQNYVTVHADGCDGCHYARADSEALCHILKKQKIPLIDFDKAGSITLVEKEPEMAYIAISHVWSDGLGNPRENSLPLCQLRRLTRHIKDLRTHGCESSLFWIDTICVPPDSVGLKEAQDSAIGLMRETYEHATAVLVFDSSLYGSASLGKSPAENLMRIFCSRWTSRLWTYQEGVLAKSLYFQFLDGSLALEAEIKRLKAEANRIHQLTIVRPLLRMYDEIRFLGKPESSFTERFGAIFSSLGDRTTSVPSDEPLCLGALLGLDIFHLAQTPPECRMQEFWRMLPYVPVSVVHCSLTRLKTHGLSWAPKTFLRSMDNQDATGVPSHWSYSTAGDKETGNVTEEGLVIQKPGLLARTGSIFIGPIMYFKFEEEDTWYTARIHTQAVTDAIPFKHFKSGNNWHFKFKAGPEESFEYIGIILDQAYDIEQQMSQSSPLMSEDTSIGAGHDIRGLLVAIKEEKDDIIHCRYLCHAYWGKTTGEHELAVLESGTPSGTGFYKEPCIWDAENELFISAVAQKRLANQYWCIA